jgi:hypothetical protein
MLPPRLLDSGIDRRPLNIEFSFPHSSRVHLPPAQGVSAAWGQPLHPSAALRCHLLRSFGTLLFTHHCSSYCLLFRLTYRTYLLSYQQLLSLLSLILILTVLSPSQVTDLDSIAGAVGAAELYGTYHILCCVCDRIYLLVVCCSERGGGVRMCLWSVSKIRLSGWFMNRIKT